LAHIKNYLKVYYQGIYNVDGCKYIFFSFVNKNHWYDSILNHKNITKKYEKYMTTLLLMNG